MRGVSFFMFLVALPALAALGFDLYLFYMNQNQGFMLSTPGYILTHYYPDGYKWTVENTTPEQWAIIDYILAQKSVIVGAAFAGFWYLILAFLKILGIWPFRRESGTVHHSGIADRLMNRKKTKFKYSRK